MEKNILHTSIKETARRMSLSDPRAHKPMCSPEKQNSSFTCVTNNWLSHLYYVETNTKVMSNTYHFDQIFAYGIFGFGSIDPHNNDS